MNVLGCAALSAAVTAVLAALWLSSSHAGEPNDGGRVATPQEATHSSSAVLAQLPDGETKRQFVIDCTNCHQMDARTTYPGGRARTAEEWKPVIARMLRMAGAGTPFPIMSASRNADSTADWLARYLRGVPRTAAPLSRGSSERVARPDVVEYLLPDPRDLPHDVAVDSSGQVIVTGMMTGAMFVLDTTARSFARLPIPVDRANPRAIEIAANGDWWVLLGAPNKVARYQPSSREWTFHDVGVYAHSVALGTEGRVWYNGHFTRDPEVIGYVDGRTGARRTFDMPRHPTMSAVAGGPIPYELRVAPNGRVWMSELQGHRMLSLDPTTGAVRAYTLPVTISAPRRFDIDSAGTVWIPAYAANALIRLDPRSGRTTSFRLPRRDAVPYVARVYGRTVWIGTNASDEVYSFDTRSNRFRIFPLPSAGAVIRHMVIDPRTGDVWLAYGASPGIPARIARLRPQG